MKHFIYGLLLCAFLFVFSCTEKTTTQDLKTKKDAQSSLNLSECLKAAKEDKLEILTWNIEHFPKNEKTTEELAALIKKMNVDVLALQEIKDKASLDALLAYLPEYKGTIMKRSRQNLAFLYRTAEISLNKPAYGILKENKHEFAGRTPFVLPIHSKSTNLDLLVINTHLKAFSDKKSQKRRTASCKLLKQFLDKNHPKDCVIVLGDMNDILTDKKSKNIFQVFLDDSRNYLFADTEIAQKKNKKMWSYQSKRYLSHIDHILITDELFENVEKVYSFAFQSCDKNYDSLITDHQPVCLVLKK